MASSIRAAAMLTKPERDALVQQHMQYARRLVVDATRALPVSAPLPASASAWCPVSAPRDELIAAGMAGLVEAASRFDPTRGAQFTTFAYYRVRGAVFDHIRRYASQSTFMRARAMAEAAMDDAIETSLAGRKREPGDGNADAAAALSQIIDLAAVSFTMAECSQALVSEASVGATPEDQVSQYEAATAVREALEELPEKERTLMTGVYLEGKTIEEAGATLGLSKSWASRLHARALAMMREGLTAQNVL